MSEKRYTLTLYIAPPNGATEHKDSNGNIVKDNSQAGHIFYAISDDGGVHKKGYGFSPVVPEMIGKGHAVANEQNIYKELAYKRTIEITEEQYNKLKAFGEASLKENHAKTLSELTKGKFSTETYNFINNSCIDYVFHALRYSGVYDHKVLGVCNKLETNGFQEIATELCYKQGDGYLNVLNNAEIFDSIPIASQFSKNSDIYNIKDNQYHNSVAEWRERTPFYYKVDNNQQEMPHEKRIDIAGNNTEPDLLSSTRDLIAHLQSGDKNALSNFTSRADIQELHQSALADVKALSQRNEKELDNAAAGWGNPEMG